MIVFPLKNLSCYFLTVQAEDLESRNTNILLSVKPKLMWVSVVLWKIWQLYFLMIYDIFKLFQWSFKYDKKHELVKVILFFPVIWQVQQIIQWYSINRYVYLYPYNWSDIMRVQINLQVGFTVKSVKNLLWFSPTFSDLILGYSSRSGYPKPSKSY